MKSLLPLIVALAFVACSQPTPDVAPTQTATQAVEVPVKSAPKRIVLMIGDGMGLNYVTAAAYAKGAPLHMMSMPEFGAITTHEYEFAGTDSAASATAFATGRKTHFEGVSVTPGTTPENETDPARHMTTLLEHAQQAGWKTGIVATSRIVHATPAAFAAHRSNRDASEEIALDLAASGVDLLMGAGSNYFTQRKDGRNLFDEMKAKGYGVATNPEEWADTKASKAIALFEGKDLQRAAGGERKVSLPDMVDQAMAFLDRDNPEGWVLVVEGSQIDWCGHDLDASCVVTETLDFDEAVGRALAYGRQRQDTLVVATSDHETGGLTVLDARYADRFVEVFGSEDVIDKRLALPQGKDLGESPDPLEYFKIGDPSGNQTTSKVSGGGPMGMTEISDARMALTWGHLSLASRPAWRGPGRFYGAHTVSLIPVFAEGVGAQYVADQPDNADVGRALFDLVGAKAPAPRGVEPTAPKNVILMIGDGYGFNTVALGNYALGDLAIRDLDVRGYVATHGVDRLVNDSAATATAMATGLRTRGGATGMVVDEGQYKPGYSILQAAEAKGMHTGLVTTTQLTHATPAAFYAAREERGDTSGIAQDFVDFKKRSKSDGIDLAIAGGRSHFTDAHVNALKGQGYEVRETWDTTTARGNLLMLLAPEGLAGAKARLRGNSPQPTLADATTFALKTLAAKNNGFFLMVEGGQIDWKLHDGVRDDTLVAEIDDFDRAVAAAAAFARENPDTLLIVTADHDHTISVLDNHYIFSGGRCGAEARCGGTFKAVEMPVAIDKIVHADGFRDPAVRGEWPPAAVFVQYAWIVQEGRALKTISAPHSAHMVPLYATGPWAHELSGYSDQTEIGQLLHRWANLSK